MGWTRGAAVLLALLTLTALGCTQLRELNALKSAIEKEFGAAPEKVVVSSKGRMTLEFSVPRYNSMPDDKLEDQATRIARFAWKNHPDSMRVNSVRVVFLKRTGISIVSMVESKGYDFTAAELAVAPSATSPPAPVDALSAAVRKQVDVAAGAEAPAFSSARVDLDDDGTEDAIVLMSARDFCGSGGCTMMIFHGTKDGFSFVSHSTITNEPIRVLQEKGHGWHTLAVRVRGGGLEPGDVLMVFDGTGYPLNPSMQPAAASERLAGARVLLDRMAK